MKRILITILLLYSNLLFGDDTYELKLYEKILPAIFKDTQIVIYGDDDANKILAQSNIFVLTSKCETATLLFGKDFDSLEKACTKIPLFTTNYHSFKNMPNSIGAFYWRKGRPQIIFNLDTLLLFNIELPNNLKKYAK